MQPHPYDSKMAESVPMENWLRGIAGATIGAALGYAAFFFLAGHGLYALVLPGVLVGFGCGRFSGVQSNALGIGCGIAALVLGLMIEWRFAPFIDDDSLGYFIMHLHQLRLPTLIMVAVGAMLAAWLGRGRVSGVPG